MTARTKSLLNGTRVLVLYRTVGPMIPVLYQVRVQYLVPGGDTRSVGPLGPYLVP